PFRAGIVSIDGMPIASRDALYDRVQASGVGTRHEYEIDSQGKRESRVIPSMILSARDYLLTMGVYAFNGLAFLASGLAVFYLKPESRQSRALLAFGLVWGLTLVLCPDLFTAGRAPPPCLPLSPRFPPPPPPPPPL